MSLGLQQILPNINADLSKIGFFFGAGTSKEAGYPLTDDLTKITFKNMDSNKKNLLEEILQKETRSGWAAALGIIDGIMMLMASNLMELYYQLLNPLNVSKKMAI